MTELNLTANGTEQQRILAYLQENASNVLAEKINSGTPFEKDGKRLINRKDLNMFMKYAEEEVLKLIAESERKGRQVRCIDDAAVFGWAIHYFEEDTIEGKLYNEDGTEYTPPKPVAKPKPTAPVKVEPKKPVKQQATLWDMIEQANKKTVGEQADEREIVADASNATDITAQENDSGPVEQVDNDPPIEEIADKLQKAIDERNGVAPKKELPPFFEQYRDMKAIHSESIVLIRLGDFYETFENDAEILADELDLTLTGRDVGLESRVSMVGFPYHASDTYIAKIRANRGVVIIESNGDVVTLAKTDMPVCKDDLPDEDEEIEELTETEMRQFDGDIQEPKMVDDTNDEETAPLYFTSSFDKETMKYLYELLDGKIDFA